MYETGNSTGVADLVQKIAVFAEKNSWKIIENENRLVLQNSLASENYFGFSVDERVTDISSTASVHYPLIYVGVSSDYTGTNTSFDAQYTSGLYQPFVAYHIFGNAQYIHVVIEINNGLFAHFGIGILNKTSEYQGGGYCYRTDYNSNYSSTYTRRGDANYSHVYPFENYNVTYGVRRFGAKSYPRQSDAFLSNWYFADSPNQMSNVSILMPFTTAINVDGGVYLVGHAPDIRSVKINYLQDGESVFLGDEEWVCFPIKRKALSAVPYSEYSSGAYGIAYKKV